MSEWISVKDKLPREEVEVLACNEAGAMVVANYFENKFYTDDDSWGIDWFNYWMPLPEPPHAD